MSVKIQIPNYLQKKTNGESTVAVNGETVKDCIEMLTLQHPGLQGEILDGRGMLLLKWVIYINEIAAGSDVLSNSVRDGDMIALLPVIAGG
jgi:molybdopterin converting factor small subunit